MVECVDMDERRVHHRQDSETTERLWKGERYKDTSSLDTSSDLVLDPVVSATHALLTKDQVPRAVVHLDADCFYAAVERQRLNVPPEVPLAVQQWSSLIAVDYNCRKFGVKRGMRVEEAQKLCPGIRFVHVKILGEDDTPSKTPERTNWAPKGSETSPEAAAGQGGGKDRAKSKVSLSRYRKASFEVMKIFNRFVKKGRGGDVLCRASIDEAYIDLTASASGLDWEKGAGNATAGSILVDTCTVGNVDRGSPHDLVLIRAASIVKKIRDAVKSELGYSISAGIATNKLLAKIGSSRNKPNKQTIIPFSNAPLCVRELPVRGIPGLGGKMGESVEKWLLKQGKRCSTSHKKEDPTAFVRVLQRVPPEELIKRFGQDTGRWLHLIAHGVDTSQVTARGEPKSLLAMKSFETTTSKQFVMEWIDMLVGEVYERHMEDKIMFKRRPTTIVFHHRGVRRRDHLERWRKGDNNATPSCTVSASLGKAVAITEQHIKNAAIGLFEKMENSLPCTRIGISLMNFIPLPKKGKGSIAGYVNKGSKRVVDEAPVNTLAGRSAVAKKRKKSSATRMDSFFRKGTNSGISQSATSQSYHRLNWGDIDQSTLESLPENIRKEIEAEFRVKSGKPRGQNPNSIRNFFMPSKR